MPSGKRTCVLSRVVPALALVLALTAPASAGWVDDWVNQKTETAPNFYQGTARSYFSAGSFDARWNLQNDYLWSITAPKLKTGCGGIDAFMGGLSFLNADYLVEKLERIMNAAPAAAFDIALKVLAPQVSDTIRSMEGFADKLNNIQLDECKASKALVATIASPFASGEKEKKLSEIQGDFVQSTGVKDLWTSFQDERKADNDKPDPAAAVGSMAGCSQEFKDVFAGGSVLNNVAGKIGLTNADYINLMRGYIGDIYIEPPSGGTGIGAYKVVYDPPCDKDTGLDDFINGDAQGKPSTGACVDIPDTNKDLQKYVRDQLLAIYNRVRSRQPLTATHVAFLNSLPLPAMQTIKTGIASYMDQGEMVYLGNIAGKAYAFRMIGDLFGKTNRMLYTAQAIMGTQGNAIGTNSAATCRIANVDEAAQIIEKIQGKTGEILDAVRQDYATALQEANALETFVRRKKQFSDEVREILEAKFNAGVAERLTPSDS